MYMCLFFVQIIRFVDDYQPGWVACEFVDAEGRRHQIVEKVPVVSSDYLDADSAYPRDGQVACEVMGCWTDAGGRELVRVTTARPWGIESSEGLAEFVLLASQLNR